MRKFVIVVVRGAGQIMLPIMVSLFPSLLPSSEEQRQTVHPGDLLSDHLLLRVHRHHLLCTTQESLRELEVSIMKTLLY